MIGAYIFDVSQGYTIKPNDQLSESTLTRYISAAVAWLGARLQIHVNISADLKSSKGLHPFIGDTIAQRKQWKQPRAKREPYTQNMYITLHDQIKAAVVQHTAHLYYKKAVVYDWVRLGLFTGSRGNEYAQTVARRGQYSRVPSDKAAGIWADTAIAFIADDFTFYDNKNRLIHHNRLATQMPTDLHIRYRYDKSDNNFTTRKYSTTNHYIFDPVMAARQIILRSRLLEVPHQCPIAVFCTKPGSPTWTYLQSKDVVTIMQQACLDTYPDPLHYMHINYKLIHCHSNRVTAAVVMRLNGADYDQIAFRLRWSEESVKHYIRDCHQTIGEDMMLVLMGALKL